MERERGRKRREEEGNRGRRRTWVIETAGRVLSRLQWRHLHLLDRETVAQHVWLVVWSIIGLSADSYLQHNILVTPTASSLIKTCTGTEVTQQVITNNFRHRSVFTLLLWQPNSRTRLLTRTLIQSMYYSHSSNWWRRVCNQSFGYYPDIGSSTTLLKKQNSNITKKNAIFEETNRYNILDNINTENREGHSQEPKHTLHTGMLGNLNNVSSILSHQQMGEDIEDEMKMTPKTHSISYWHNTGDMHRGDTSLFLFP